MFATFMLMNEERQSTCSVKRICLNPMIAVCMGLLFFDGSYYIFKNVICCRPMLLR